MILCINIKSRTMKIILEKRLIKFASDIIKLTESFNNSYASKHLASQLIRSGTSPALNYGEALNAESKKDFIHKLSIILKELKETKNNLEIIINTNISNKPSIVQILFSESDQLITIFFKSIQTAKRKNEK